MQPSSSSDTTTDDLLRQVLKRIDDLESRVTAAPVAANDNTTIGLVHQVLDGVDDVKGRLTRMMIPITDSWHEVLGLEARLTRNELTSLNNHNQLMSSIWSGGSGKNTSWFSESAADSPGAKFCSDLHILCSTVFWMSVKEKYTLRTLCLRYVMFLYNKTYYCVVVKCRVQLRLPACRSIVYYTRGSASQSKHNFFFSAQPYLKSPSNFAIILIFINLNSAIIDTGIYL